ncbi:unnamed protein product [Linum tenue]|uniref:Myb/SANT-like DNA-binding domain-containing protein n=1 Tax=Linum tenue TaxID=586396 RepID=A0AAV0JEQ8_9ROSI|nr:unnamed protein product [Linum tenue]
MDGSSMGGRFMLGSIGGSLDLEAPPMHRNQHSQMGNHSMHHHHHRQVNLTGGIDNDGQSMGLMESIGLARKGHPASYGKANDDDLSEEDDDPNLMEDGQAANSLKGTKISPWHRMKWTDNVVRLLIAVVAYVGDDGPETGESHKRKSVVLQKKGKWKTVSKVMIGKGCHVSPQQCEDKFNDLNKRYKKLNDILGRGTSCQVVENPGLMESMPHLSSKAKDEVRKILSSKQLFYQEICAYHNGQKIPNCPDVDLQGCSLPVKGHWRENDGSDEDEENDESEDDDSENEDENVNINAERTRRNEEGNSFEVEMAAMFRDPNVTSRDRNQWVKKQMFHLQGQRVSIVAESLQLEKQRLNWLRYRSKKDMEFERLKIENETLRLENEQSMARMKMKQLEVDLRHSDASVDPITLGTQRPQGKE